MALDEQNVKGSKRPRSEFLGFVHERFRYWFGPHYDLDVLDAVLAAAAVERLDGEPLWILVLSGPSTSKTETVASLIKCERVFDRSTFTSDAAFLSGTSERDRSESATGGLLKEIGARGIIVFKDLTGIMSLGPVARGRILAALRDIYDGSWKRSSGSDGGNTLAWSGRITVIGAVTSVWDRHYAAVSKMGDRFVLVRMNSEDEPDGMRQRRIDNGRKAIDNTGYETSYRGELPRLCAKLINTVPILNATNHDLKPVGPQLSTNEIDRLVSVADLVTQARTAVEFDRYTNQVVDADDLEGPTRFAKQLAQMARGARLIGLDRNDAMRLAIRCGRDSLPPLRLQVMEHLAKEGPSNIADVAKALSKPRSSVERQLESLYALEVLSHETVEGKYRYEYQVYRIREGIDPGCLEIPLKA